ncbi:ATP-binding cassette domain-containing protein [Bacillus thuringiensis]
MLFREKLTGKSTLLKLLTGALSPVIVKLYSMVGQLIRIFYLNIFVLNQSYLFDTTIGNNVRIGKPEVTDEEIWKVERESTSFTCYFFPDGLQTNVLNGKRFSGGEERVAFARTLCKKHPIIVLDEPTIGLDRQNHQLKQCFLQRKKRRLFGLLTIL